MPQNTPTPARICPNCDGFAQVAIVTGTRHRDSTRTTITAHCPACHGTGTTARPTVAVLTPARG